MTSSAMAAKNVLRRAMLYGMLPVSIVTFHRRDVD